MYTKFGMKLPFETSHVEIGALDDKEGWLPGQWSGKRGRQVLMAPLSHYPDSTKQQARFVAVVHECPEYLKLKAAVGAKEPAWS
jgi:hypothetical protein